MSVDLAAEVTRHADLILRASGSSLKNYTMPANRKAILGAVMDCYEEAFRAGAEFARERMKPADIAEFDAEVIEERGHVR